MLRSLSFVRFHFVLAHDTLDILDTLGTPYVSSSPPGSLWDAALRDVASPPGSPWDAALRDVASPRGSPWDAAVRDLAAPRRVLLANMLQRSNMCNFLYNKYTNQQFNFYKGRGFNL